MRGGGERFFVYGLFDPLEPNVIRYVGAASYEGRPLRHGKDARDRSKKTYKHNWIRSLGERGYGWRVLRGCGSWDETMVAEKEIIASFRAAGANLTNGTGGGEGMYAPTPEVRAKCTAAIRAALARPGMKERLSLRLKGKKRAPFSEEWKQKLLAARAALRGTKRSEETRRKMSLAQSGRAAPSPETRRKLSAAKMGHVVSGEARKKISDAHKGRKLTLEHVEKMRAALTGKPRSPEARAILKAAWVVRRAKMNVRVVP